MGAAILNRDFQHPADGWYQIEPKGEHPNRAAGVIQVIDDEAAQSIVNRFNADAAAGRLRHGNEMLIDHEHFSDNPEQETRAYGWLQELQNRADGIYGRIRWTATGKPAVDGGDYRFFSTEYDPADLKTLNSSQGAQRARPLRLDGLSLTNMNNNRGMKPITNSARATAVSADDNSNPQAACAARFNLIVNRIKKETGCTFDAAWNHARQLEPRLFAGISNRETPNTSAAPTANFQNREVQFASERLRNIAECDARKSGTSFATAWGMACRRFPDLNAKANGRVTNRASAIPEGVDAADWKRALENAGDVAAAIQSEASETPDRGNLVESVAALRGAFKRYLGRLQADDGMTFQQAFDHIKDTEPVFWSRVVLDYADGSE